MRKLIYFVSYTDEYNEMLRICISSLLPHIDESYDVVVFSDCLEVDGSWVRVEIVNQPYALRRANVANLIDISEYDFVYYFDHDIIFHRNLNDLITDENKVILCRELSLKMNSNQTNLLRSEIEQVGHELSINAGSVIVPKKYFNTFFKYWKETIDWYRWSINSEWTKHWGAQSSLSKMYANKVCEFGFIEDYQVHWPADPHNSFKTERTVFSHYAGMTMEKRKELMIL